MSPEASTEEVNSKNGGPTESSKNAPTTSDNQDDSAENDDEESSAAATTIQVGLLWTMYYSSVLHGTYKRSAIIVATKAAEKHEVAV